MNRKILVLCLFHFACLMIDPVELKFSEEYRPDSTGVLRANKELAEQTEHNDADEHADKTVVEFNVNEPMQGDQETVNEETANEQTTQTDVNFNTITENGTQTSSDILNEDIPSSTSSTKTIQSTDEIVGSQVTTEDTESLFTTETTTISDDSENTVEDIVVKTTTESEFTHEETSVSNNAENITKTISVNKLSDQIKLVLKQYQKTGNVVVPDVKIPDPMPIPDMDKRMSLVAMNFKNQTVHGLSNFTVQHVNTDLEKMQVYVMLHMKRLVVLGNYSMKSFFNKASGPFNVTLIDVLTEGAAALQYTPDGELEASKTNMDMSFQNIKMDFKNLGIMGSFFQGVVGAVGNLIFEGIKAPILTEVNTKMKDDVNIKIRTMSKGFKTSASVNPVDQAILEGRRYVVDQGYDPYVIRNYTMNFAGLFKLNLTELTLNGLSRFYRVGEVSLSMDNGTVEFDIHLAADNITGNCSWSAGWGRTKIRDGISSYVVDVMQGRAIIRQSLDLSKPPQLSDIDFRLGEIKLQTNREDVLDLIAESVVNNLPLLIRHIIVDGLEVPVKVQAQKILDQVDVSGIVEDQLPKLDEMGV